jgi:hypothetical protein
MSSFISKLVFKFGPQGIIIACLLLAATVLFVARANAESIAPTKVLMRYGINPVNGNGYQNVTLVTNDSGQEYTNAYGHLTVFAGKVYDTNVQNEQVYDLSKTYVVKYGKTTKSYSYHWLLNKNAERNFNQNIAPVPLKKIIQGHIAKLLVYTVDANVFYPLIPGPPVPPPSMQ